MRSLLIALFAGIFIAGCSKEEKTKLVPLDLLAYDVPLKIMAPDSAVVKKEDWGAMQIVTVKKGKDYDLQIQSSEATSTNAASIKEQKLIDVKNEKYFSKIVQEDDFGFVFETQPDEKTNYYGFLGVIVKGDKEYIIQNGLAGTYTLEQAQSMYNAVKPKEE